MEEGMKSLPEAVRKTFSCRETDAARCSPLTLAFLGDCVYDLIIRTLVVERANASPNTLHKKKSEVVKAAAQSACAKALEEELTEEEYAVYKRGRNAHPHTTAKNASLRDYHRATGLEALYGFLYLTDRMDRLFYLVKRSFELTGTVL